MKNKLLLSLGSSLLVFAPITTVIACGDEPTLDAFTVYVNKIVLTAPSTGTKTIAALDAVVARTTTPVAVGSQQVATDIKDELGLSAFTINSVNAEYAITYQLIAKGTPVAGQIKTYTMTVSVKNTSTNLTKMKTVDVKSLDTVPATDTGTTQAQLDTYINGLVITDGQAYLNKTIAQLDAIVASSTSGTALDATAVFTGLNVDVDTRTKPADVTLTYVLTKNSDDAEGAKQSYSLVVTGRTTAGLVKAKAPHKVMSSENKPLSVQTIVNSFTYTSLQPKTISVLDGLVTTTANYIEFNLSVAATYFETNNFNTLSTQHPTVTWAYKVTKGTTTPSAPQPYTFEIKATRDGVSASKNIDYNSSDNAPVPFTQENLATYVNTTITYSEPANKTIETLSTYVTTSAIALSPAIATALGLTLGTTPSGVSLTYTLTKGAETEGSPVIFTLTVTGAHAGLTDVTRTETITSSDNALHPDQVIVNANKAAFVAMFGSSYNETTITTVPVTTSTTLADAVTPTFTPTNGAAVEYVMSARNFNIDNMVANITITATFTKDGKTATHTFTVEYSTVKTAMGTFSYVAGDVQQKLTSKNDFDKTKTAAEAAALYTNIGEILPNHQPNENFTYTVNASQSVGSSTSLYVSIVVTYTTIPSLTKTINYSFDEFAPIS